MEEPQIFKQLYKCHMCNQEFPKYQTIFCSCSEQFCSSCFDYYNVRNSEQKCPACSQIYKKVKYKKPCKEYPPANKQELQGMRVLQKSLVYLIGLSPELADENLLQKEEYFGQYGTIRKVVVNKANVYNDSYNRASFSAYVTYYNEQDATRAIQSVDGFFINNRVLRASYGTTKYCNYFIKEMICTNQSCLYLHTLGEEQFSYTKSEMKRSKHLQHKVPTKKLSSDYKTSNPFFKPVLPPPSAELNFQSNQVEYYGDQSENALNQIEFDLPSPPIIEEKLVNSEAQKQSRYSFAEEESITDQCPVSEEIHTQLMHTLEQGFVINSPVKIEQKSNENNILQMSRGNFLYLDELNDILSHEKDENWVNELLEKCKENANNEMIEESISNEIVKNLFS